MLFSAFILAIAGTVSASPVFGGTSKPPPQPDSVTCKDPHLCLKIDTLFLAQPNNAKDGDEVSLDFQIYDPNPDKSIAGFAQCDDDWKYGAGTFPQSPVECGKGFQFYLVGFTDSSKDFYIMATHTVKKPGSPDTTYYAKGKVSTTDNLKCTVSMDSFKTCELMDKAEVYLVKYTPPPNKPPAV